MKERQGFTFDREGKQPVAEKKAELDKSKVRMDAYDRARQTIAFMNRMSTTGQIPDDHMANFYAATAITEGLLAVADAMYITSGISRGPLERSKS